MKEGNYYLRVFLITCKRNPLTTGNILASASVLLKGHKKGQAPHSTQLLRLPLLPSGPDGVHPIVVAWDPT